MRSTNNSDNLLTTIPATKNDQDFIREILKHYKMLGRHELPWRKKINAYRILVSEIMLQQTQVARVIPKFEMWMKEYPTLTSLRQSNLKDVLIHWQGLGYQRRAKALYEIAKTLKSLPKNYDELIPLQGVGSYTAGAIMAFAYDIFTHPVLETNIRTVLIEHFHNNETAVSDTALKNDLARLQMYREVQKIGARHFYYALMDMGAYLKVNNISHNNKSKHTKRQSLFKGSLRELRAKTLFAITNGVTLPEDKRLIEVLNQLLKEGFIKKKGTKYSIV